MLEPLAGRLKWERTEDGIRVEYRIRGNYPAMWGVMKAFWRIYWPALIVLVLLFLTFDFVGRHGHGAGWWSARWWADPLGVLFGALLGRFISILANRTTLTLNPTKLELEFRRWNWRRGRETYLTAHLNNLRFANSTRDDDTRNGLRLNEIQFDNDFAAQYFATGITETEAKALIAKMMEVYPFPQWAPAFRGAGNKETTPVSG